MAQRLTEELHDKAHGLDALPLGVVADIAHQAQLSALAVVGQASEHIAQAAQHMANTIRNGGCLHYGATGSSGLMALADACELAGTFGINPSQIAVHMAGGIPHDPRMPGDSEDDVAEASKAAETFKPGDTIVLISASGSTPYALELARAAHDIGSIVIALANTTNAALFNKANVAISLPTPPEIVAGSTRLGAATAQKAALNSMSTLMGIALGHVHDGMMVNVRADNLKLHARATRIVSTIASVDESLANACLQQAGGLVKPAVLLAAGASNLDDANAQLKHTGDHLRAALEAMRHPIE